MTKKNKDAQRAYSQQEFAGTSLPDESYSLGDLLPSEEESSLDSEEKELIDKLSDDELYKLCGDRICPMCPQQKEAEEIRLRSLAELENARKRLAREKEEFITFAAEGVLSDIVPCIDNLDLALQHSSSSPECKNLALGVEMTKKLLLESLKKHGLEQVGNVGDEFDPSLHEAVGVEEFAELEPNHIGKLLSHGYKLHKRLLRPAKVIVSKN